MGLLLLGVIIEITDDEDDDELGRYEAVGLVTAILGLVGELDYSAIFLESVVSMHDDEVVEAVAQPQHEEHEVHEVEVVEGADLVMRHIIDDDDEVMVVVIQHDVDTNE